MSKNANGLSLGNLTSSQTEIISDVSQLYTGLEYIITYNAEKLSDAAKLNLKRLQGMTQKLRLKLLDQFGVAVDK